MCVITLPFWHGSVMIDLAAWVFLVPFESDVFDRAVLERLWQSSRILASLRQEKGYCAICA